MNSNVTHLVDLNGKIVQSWHGASRIASTPYLLKGGDLIRPCQVDSPSMVGAAFGGRIQRISKNQNVLWDWSLIDDDVQPHHDICPMPNGNILIVAWERKSQKEGIALGRQNLYGEIWPTKIIEIKPVGSSSADIVWEWSLWDHLIQDISPVYPNYGVVQNHPEKLNINVGTVTAESGDWIHVNAIDYNEKLDQIVFSSNDLDEIYIIDHSTTTEEASGSTGGNSGMGGDFLYRWGNSQNYNRGSDEDHILHNVHGVNWIDSGLPGQGHLILFNNGNDDASSDLIEFMPPLNSKGTYSLPMDGAPYYPPRGEYEWFYESPDFWGDHLSGVYRLPNGNTLATDGPNREIREVDYDGNIVWTLFTSARLMRAQKFPLDILELDEDCLEDVNGDGIISVLDLLELLSHYGSAGPSGDINQDNQVNTFDLLGIISQFGQACSG